MSFTATTEIDLLDVPRGKYVVAVSGGVDSMVLLDLLKRNKKLQLVVAHVDHGIRPDSKLDRLFVAAYCMSHNIKCEFKELHLGQMASENEARKARYEFLQKCRIKHNANAIVTAHHQDDLIETAIINILRGTGWRGLAPLTSRPEVMRPLLKYSKQQIIDYAKQRNIKWREDSTNQNQNYLRNYVRHTMIPELERQNSQWRQAFVRHICKQLDLRRKIVAELVHNLDSHAEFTKKDESAWCSRYWWIMLPVDTAYELFQALCYKQTGSTVVHRLAEDAIIFIKTALPGKTMPLGTDWRLRVTIEQLIVEPSSSVVS